MRSIQITTLTTQNPCFCGLNHGKSTLSHGFPMIFPWFSHGFSTNDVQGQGTGLASTPPPRCARCCAACPRRSRRAADVSPCSGVSWENPMKKSAEWMSYGFYECGYIYIYMVEHHGFFSREKMNELGSIYGYIWVYKYVYIYIYQMNLDES